MKTIYIPKGETIRYESLATEHLVVHGCLQVTCGITAKTITGYGTVHAGTVNADVIRVDDMDAGSIVCKRLLATLTFWKSSVKAVKPICTAPRPTCSRNFPSSAALRKRPTPF